MSEDGEGTTLSAKEGATWAAWWPAASLGMASSSSSRVCVWTEGSSIKAHLESNPEDAVALHDTVSARDAELLLAEARQGGWSGPWAAPRKWLEAHPAVSHSHGPALGISSWTEFLTEPWRSVGRAEPLSEAQSKRASKWSLNALPVPAAVVLNGSIGAANRPFAALLGIPANQLGGLPIVSLWRLPEESRDFVDAMTAQGTGPREVSVEARWRRPDRRDLWVDLKGRCMAEEDGMAGAWMVVANDISRHRRTQEFLQIQRNLVEYAQDGIAIIDVSREAGSHLVFVNSAWEKMTGYAAEEVIGDDVSILVRDDRGQTGFQTLRKAIDRREAANATLRNYRKDGRLFFADTSVFPLPGERGRSAQHVVITRDVTEKRATELRLIESERRFRHLFSDNRLPMLLVDSGSGAILDANPAASEFYGYNRQKFGELREDHLVVSFGDREKVTSWPRTTVSPERGLTEQSQQHRCADGTTREVVTYSGELQVADGRMRYVIVVDISAQFEAEEKLRKAIEAAESASVAKSEFLQVVSHEIRTPMNAIQGFADLLKSSETTEEFEESVEMVLQGTRDLTAVLDSVTDFIRWGSETACETDVETSFLELAIEGMGDMKERAEMKGLAFRARWPRGEDTIWLPAGDYARMILILLNNAVKFTASGKVSLDLTVAADASRLTVRVSDTGIGIDPAMGDRLFTPFCSGDEGTRRAYGGIGLGLARCARMVRAHGGQIGYQSRVGKGSTFVLELPFRKEPR